MDLTPPMRSLFMDLTGGLINFQHQRKCADFELHFYECMEAYGIPRGYKKCSDMFEDYRECALTFRQMLREDAIRDEHERQVKAGTRSYSDPPKEDSY